MNKTQMLMPQTFSELERWAKMASTTDWVPKEYRGKPADVLICAQYSIELGLGIVEGLRSIAVINGKPSLYGDGLLALCQKSAVYEYCKETPMLDGAGNVYGYICEAKRKGENAKMHRFTMEDAKRAKLSSKVGPWQEYPQRMLQMRARGFALRDAFADVTRGLISREEAEDYPTGEIIEGGTASSELTPEQITPEQVDEIRKLTREAGISDDDFAKLLVAVNAPTIEEIRASYYPRIVNTLIHRRARRDEL